MRINILFRHFIYYALIIVCTTLIIAVVTSREYKKNYLNTLEANLQKQAVVISSSIKDLLLRNRYTQTDSIITALAQKTNNRITIIRSDGYVIGESDHDTKSMEDHSSRPEFIQALRFGVGKKIRYSETTQQNMLYVAVPIIENNKTIAVVRVSSYIFQIQKDLVRANKKIIYLTIGLTVLALLLAVLSSRNLTRPIRIINRVAERIKNGEFNARIILKRKDEIGRLSDSINNMAESLNTLFNQISSEREDIKTILSSMVEGLVVLDEQDRITMANDNFKSIVSFTEKDIQGKYYWEIITSSQFSELVKAIKEKGIIRDKEIEFNNRIYLANGNLTFKARGRKSIIVLHDITEAKNLERIKSDFIANVSHELKTPLTSIKGFAETLSNEAGKKYRHFAETISRNADRLINIVQDLLVISELERKEEHVQKESVDLGPMLKNIKKIFSAKLKQKKLRYKMEIDKATQKVSGDPFLLEQMLTNLIDNAIKYNLDKGKILVSVKKSENNTIITVKDSGIGIDQLHIPRIFERFYVVDKSRSRKMGGTGLGLAIVKHIVLTHNGGIDVESEVGKGTKFVITLPEQ